MYVVLFVGTSSRAFLPRVPLRPFPRYSIVVLCARARGSVRYVVGRLFVCLRMQTFLTGVLHDVLVFNIEGSGVSMVSDYAFIYISIQISDGS